jgi:hypothetical protein
MDRATDPTESGTEAGTAGSTWTGATGQRSAPLHFVPYSELDESTPSVVVDGSSAAGTVLCLSHWPGIGSPAEFRADLSAEMAFLYLAAFDRHGAATAVSNNHYDQDGLVGVFALSSPEEALARRDLLVEVARAGDFASTSSRQAARVSMALAAYADGARSPLPGIDDERSYDEKCARLYTELMGRLPELCDHTDRFRALWADEDETLSASMGALASGEVTIREVPDVDLAVVDVRVPAAAPSGGGHRFASQWAGGLHPMALYNATDCGAILTVRGRRYELAYRYESWVQFRTRAVRPRRDLVPLADAFTSMEAEAGGSAVWRAEMVSGLTPVLSLRDDEAESRLAPERVLSVVEEGLRTAPPAWDPYEITR